MYRSSYQYLDQGSEVCRRREKHCSAVVGVWRQISARSRERTEGEAGERHGSVMLAKVIGDSFNFRRSNISGSRIPMDAMTC